MVLVDYCKVFDMVDHKLLLRKLELYGIVGIKRRSWKPIYSVINYPTIKGRNKPVKPVICNDAVKRGKILNCVRKRKKNESEEWSSQ